MLLLTTTLFVHDGLPVLHCPALAEVMYIDFQFYLYLLIIVFSCYHCLWWSKAMCDLLHVKTEMFDSGPSIAALGLHFLNWKVKRQDQWRENTEIVFPAVNQLQIILFTSRKDQNILWGLSPRYILINLKVEVEDQGGENDEIWEQIVRFTSRKDQNVPLLILSPSSSILEVERSEVKIRDAKIARK